MKKQKLLAVILALVMTLSLLPTAALAADIFAGGEGTSDSPYQIETVDQLKAFRDSVNSGTTYENQYVALTSDIDLGGESWTPIGLNADGAEKFRGTFDGGNYTISNLTITATAPAYRAYGLFGALNGTVKYLKLKTVRINATSGGEATDNGIAAVAGSIYTGGLIDHVAVSDVVISGNHYIGGIAGYVYGSITNCTVTDAVLTATPNQKSSGEYDNGDKVGGVAGYFPKDSNNTISGNKVKNITVSGYRDLGGVVGCADADAVTNNTADGVILKADQTTVSYGEKDINFGGVIGRYLSGTGSDSTASNVIFQVNDARTLNAAIGAANSGDTVTLLKDVKDINDNLRIEGGKKITVNLNEHNVSFKAGKYFFVCNGTLNLTGSGKVYEQSPYYGPVLMKGSTTDQANYSVVNVGKDVILEGWAGLFMANLEVDGKNYGYGMVANVEGTLIGKNDGSDDGYGLYLNGNVVHTTGNVPSITIASTAKLTGDGAAWGIYQAGYADTTIADGAVIEGKCTGIEIRAGKLTVNGGTITGNGIPTDVTTPNGNGTTTDGVGIAVAQHTTKLPIKVTINSGDISGFYALYESNPQVNSAEDIAKVNITVNGGNFKAINGGTGSVYSENKTHFISGGLFNIAPDSKYVDADKVVVPSGNSSYPHAVGIAVSGVTLDKSSTSIVIGEKETLTATVAPAEATNKSVTWTSSDEKVATVSGGTVTGVAPGTATIKASVATIGGSETATCVVTVLDKFTVKFESSQGTAPKALTVVQGETIDLPDAPEDVDTTVYVFNGWKLGDEIYQPTSISEKAYTATGSVTFVAQWNKIVVPADPEEAGSTQIEVTTGEVNASVDVPEEQKEAAEQIAEDLAGTTVLDEEAEKAMTDAAEKLAQDQSVVDKALKDAEENGVTAGENENRTVVVKTYMDVAVKSVEGNKAVLDITPKYDVIVSNGTKVHKAVEGEKLEVKADEKNPIVITLPLPEALKDMKSIFVRHETKDGTVYYYEAKIDKENGTITFANPHGFSEFTLLGGVETSVDVTRIGPNSTAAAGTDLGKMTLDMVGVEMNVSLGSGANVPSGKNWRFNGWTITATKSAVGEEPAETITLAEKVSAVNEETYYEMVKKAKEGYAITMDCLTPGLYVRSSGGSSSSSSYSVSVSSGKHGEVTASPKTASKGTTVTLSVKPDKGYELDKLTVTDKNGDNVKLTKKSDTQYTFTMPASKITVKAEFVEIEKAPAHAFTDVADGFWAEDAIVWAFEKGYMNGTSDTTFNPGGNVSRQQLWMILARVSGQNPANMAEAKSWAVDNGISDGTTPGGSVTRQQMVAILYRYATLMGYDVSAKADLGAYPDAASVAGYAKDAMAWSVANGIVGGTTQGTLNPAGTASRAQFAVILNRFCGKMA